MILTVTMNPAVDKTVKIEGFCVDKVNLIQEARTDAGGKGINVSKIVRQLGGRTRTLVFLGGSGGKLIEEELKHKRIGLAAVHIQGETRTNTKIVDPVRHTFTDVNEPGPEISPLELVRFVEKLKEEITAQTVVVFTGSVPRGVPDTIYRDLIAETQRIGAKAVLDADRDLLKYGLEAKPYLVKPNIHELERFVGHPVETLDQVKEAARHLLNSGIANVIVTLGEEGALFATSKAMIRAAGIPVTVLSTVGAGDALLGAWCYGVDKQLPLHETMRLAIASSAAMISVEGTAVPELDRIHQLMGQVELTEV